MKYLFDEQYSKSFDFSPANPIVNKLLEDFDNDTEILEQSVYNVKVKKDSTFSPPYVIGYKYHFKYKHMLYGIDYQIFDKVTVRYITYATQDVERVIKEEVFGMNSIRHLIEHIDIKHTKLYKHMASVEADMRKELHRYVELDILE